VSSLGRKLDRSHAIFEKNSHLQRQLHATLAHKSEKKRPPSRLRFEIETTPFLLASSEV
jgi:hypothetical protein